MHSVTSALPTPRPRALRLDQQQAQLADAVAAVHQHDAAARLPPASAIQQRSRAGSKFLMNCPAISATSASYSIVQPYSSAYSAALREMIQPISPGRCVRRMTAARGASAAPARARLSPSRRRRLRADPPATAPANRWRTPASACRARRMSCVPWRSSAISTCRRSALEVFRVISCRRCSACSVRLSWPGSIAEVADQLGGLRALAMRQLVKDACLGQRDFGVQVFRLDQPRLPRIEAVEAPQHRHVGLEFFGDCFPAIRRLN